MRVSDSRGRLGDESTNRLLGLGRGGAGDVNDDFTRDLLFESLEARGVAGGDLAHLGLFGGADVELGAAVAEDPADATAVDPPVLGGGGGGLRGADSKGGGRACTARGARRG